MKRILLFFALFAFIGSLEAESLWKEGSLYSSSKFKKGDLLKIVFKQKRLVEFSTFQENQESASLNNPNKSGTMVLNFLPQLSGDNLNKASKSANLKNKDNLDISIMAAVQSIDSNGNLLIAGQHNIQFNNQMETVSVQGIVSPGRITGDKIFSDDIYDLKMAYDRTVYKKELVNPADLKDSTSVSNMEFQDPKKREIIIKYLNQVLPLLFQ